MRVVAGVLGAASLALAACGGEAERATIARLDEMMMVFIEPPVRSGERAEAVVHYVFAKPELMDGERRVTRMVQQFTFDCPEGGVAERVQTLTLEDGQVMTNEFARLDFRNPEPETVLADIRDRVCDPAVAKKHRAPVADLATAEKRYRRMLADGKL